jgi:hypothetical protein
MVNTEAPDIYHAIVKFRKNSKGEKTVRVQIRPSKKGRQKRKDFPFPKEINENYLPPWKYHGGEQIIVYHRRGDGYDYIDMNHSKVPMDNKILNKLIKK